MVFNALQINSYVFSEEIGANAKKIRLVDERSTQSLAAAECELSVDYITGHPAETSGCGHATFGFRSAPAGYSMNVVVRIGKQRLSKPRDCHQIARMQNKSAALSNRCCGGTSCFRLMKLYS